MSTRRIPDALVRLTARFTDPTRPDPTLREIKPALQPFVEAIRTLLAAAPPTAPRSPAWTPRMSSDN
ncbi:hypothetical protein ACIOD1_11485 [Streptomyces sp. NPDC088097]|uniref:hypothetical protein n=1 Tax=Streptomyces sp. NPDC088097 TaxID=3365823 RepID=UPI00381DCDCF